MTWLDMDALQMSALHMGALHPIEKLLTLGLAFGPFLILAVVIWIRRRQDGADGTSPERQEEPQRER